MDAACESVVSVVVVVEGHACREGLGIMMMMTDSERRTKARPDRSLDAVLLISHFMRDFPAPSFPCLPFANTLSQYP